MSQYKVNDIVILKDKIPSKNSDPRHSRIVVCMINSTVEDSLVYKINPIVVSMDINAKLSEMTKIIKLDSNIILSKDIRGKADVEIPLYLEEFVNIVKEVNNSQW